MLAASLAAEPPSGEAPPLPAPKGRVVKIGDEAELQREVRQLKSDTTLLIAPGTYRLTNTLHVRGGVKNVAIRGASNRRGDVVLVGRGMRNEDKGDVPHGILVSEAEDVLIANLSVGDVWFHPVAVQGEAKRVRVYNVRMFEAGEQFVKGSLGADGRGSDGGAVEHCVMEYAEGARSDYTNGVDVHGGKGWVIRNNLFRNIRGPEGTLAGPAVLMWNGASETVCERNLFVNCQRGIAFGLMDREGKTDHRGGRIVDNWFLRRESESGDAAVIVWDSPGTVVERNTLVCSGTYATPIEVRFAESVDVRLKDNVLDGKVWLRDGAKATEDGTKALSGAELRRAVEAMERAAATFDEKK